MLQQKDTTINLPAPRSFLKNKLLEISRTRRQHQRNTVNTVRNICKIIPKLRNNPTFWHRNEILLTTGYGPFPTDLNRFHLRSEEKCGCGEQGSPIHYATECQHTSCFHFKKPAPIYEDPWWQRIITSTLFRAKIRNLMDFI
ncbi:hypothetical protein AVEN_43593-1 [Araneus ventricosus]|uniref:Uncharacterized protein n=1 Tax=Araneus ventricosus TaxID=182803 RepID=A0A4Y2EI97_ARAVE|nr:hypothetical protein AVEN_43593-1 [Araneus ventricosus]